jgi:hypothetical protein
MVAPISIPSGTFKPKKEADVFMPYAHSVRYRIFEPVVS